MHTSVKVACLATAAIGVCVAWSWLTAAPESKFAKEVEEAEDDPRVAEECLTDTHVWMEDKDNLTGGLVQMDVDDEGTVVVASTIDKTEPVEVRGSRIVLSKNRATYARRVLDACKAKFGTPKVTEANHRAIWRYAQSMMKDHGLRPSHQARILPVVVALAFECSAAEVEAGHVRGSWKAAVAGRYDEHLSRMARWTAKVRRGCGLA